MGCHTWFSRPITEEEFELMKQYAPIEIYNLVGDSEKNIEIGAYNKVLFKSLMKSYNEDIPCVSGKYWWQLGWGGGNSKFMNGKAYVHEVRKKNGLYVDLGEYTDTFKVNNYSKKVITNRKNLRKWMRKRYFDLEEWQLEKISKFFKESPDGVITFG